MSVPDTNRSERLARRRARTRAAGLVGVAIGIVALTVAGAVALRGTAAGPRLSASPNSPQGGGGGSDVSGTATSVVPPRAISHDNPLQLWVGGDSLAGELGPSLGDQLGPTGVVSVRVDFKVGSGLHDNGLRNWPARAVEEMRTNQPDVAIFMIGANDASIVSSNGAWIPVYRSKVDAMMTVLSDHGRRPLYWVGPPPLRAPNLERGTKALSDLMQTEAAAHRNVTFVDAYTLFAGPDGHYTNRIDMPTLHKVQVLVRIADGVHFTNDGADWLAYDIATRLDRAWQISTQAGGAPIEVQIEQGGGVIPGYKPRHKHIYGASSTTSATGSHSTTSSTPLDSSTTTGGTVTTSPPSTSPSTAPPSTSPPTTPPTT